MVKSISIACDINSLINDNISGSVWGSECTLQDKSFIILGSYGINLSGKSVVSRIKQCSRIKVCLVADNCILRSLKCPCTKVLGR